MDQNTGTQREAEVLHGDGALRYMRENSFFDIDFFIKSITNDSLTSYVYFGDMRQNQFYISDNMRKKFGFSQNIVTDLIKKWEKRIYSAEEKRRYRKNIRTMMEEKGSIHDMRYRVVDTDGKVIWIRCCGSLKWNEDRTEPLFFSGRISTQDEVYFIDPVSNLPGGTMLLRHLELIQAERRKTKVIGFCLNHMEKINGLQGRTYGDRLIHDISAELQSAMMRSWSFYRLDGMRFAAVGKGAGTNVEAGIQKIRDIIGDFYEKMGIPLKQLCSFAEMRFPVESLTPIDFQDNLISMIRYARQHPGYSCVREENYSLFREQMIANSEILLHRNILDGMVDFRPVVQPIVSSRTGRIMGGETLLRWKNDNKDVSPAIFIPVLERSQMIYTVGRWIFDQAVKICSEMLAAEPSFYLTVNISLQQLSDDGLLEHMEQTLTQYGLEGSHISVELTESCMDQEPEKLTRFVQGCKALGMHIALDDFGSGYSSMRVLMKYPSDVIKLDRSILLEMTESEEKMNFISSIVYACHKFGKQVCIEGVETEIQRQMAEDADCDMIQGFYYYRPMEIDAIRELYQLPVPQASNAVG